MAKGRIVSVKASTKYGRSRRGILQTKKGDKIEFVSFGAVAPDDAVDYEMVGGTAKIKGVRRD